MASRTGRQARGLPSRGPLKKNNLDCGREWSLKKAILNHSSIFEEEFDLWQAGRGGRREGFPLEVL